WAPGWVAPTGRDRHAVRKLLLLRKRRGVDLVEHVLGLGEGGAELVEEVAREPLVAGGAGVKAAQRGTAQLGVLLGRQALGERRVLVPEVLVVLGAVGCPDRSAERGEGKSGQCQTLHLWSPYLSCDRTPVAR